MEYKSYISVKELIHNSILFEQESADFYHTMKTRTKDKNALELLDLLEKQELSHKTRLENLSVKEDDTIMIQFPPDMSMVLPEMDNVASLSFAGILDRAIEIEVFAQKIYHESGLLCRGKVQELLLSLEDFEKVHERSLRELKSL
jgi:rubrerythrin